MAYSSTNPVLCIAQNMTGPSMYTYTSTEDSSDVAVAGYFTACGKGSRGGLANAGMKTGDIVLTIASTNSSQPSECVAHAVIGSTADQASTAGATGWNTAYDASISAT